MAICPWNKFASIASEAKLKARDDLKSPPLADLLALDDAGFRALFSGSPIKRIGRDRFIRNVLISAGNSEDPKLAKPVANLLDDPSPLVRGTAVWALSELLPLDEIKSLGQKQGQETDETVIAEWRIALGGQMN